MNGALVSNLVEAVDVTEFECACLVLREIEAAKGKPLKNRHAIHRYLSHFNVKIKA